MRTKRTAPFERYEIPDFARGDTNQNPPGLGLVSLLREDYRTHESKLFEQGFWAVAVHRLGNARMSIRPKLLRLPFSILYKILYKHVEWMCGISLPYTVKLGRRVRIWHHGGMILHARSIGDDVHIRQNTTFGVARTAHNFELPIIEDRADIGCNAVVLGPITIGHDAKIGAGAVVLKSVPAHAVAVGVPARVIDKSPPSNECRPPDWARAGAVRALDPMRPLVGRTQTLANGPLIVNQPEESSPQPRSDESI